MYIRRERITYIYIYIYIYIYMCVCVISHHSPVDVHFIPFSKVFCQCMSFHQLRSKTLWSSSWRLLRPTGALCTGITCSSIDRDLQAGPDTNLPWPKRIQVSFLHRTSDVIEKPSATMGISSMVISGTDWLEVPTIYKAHFLGLCKGIFPQNITLSGTVPPF